MSEKYEERFIEGYKRLAEEQKANRKKAKEGKKFVAQWKDEVAPPPISSYRETLMRNREYTNDGKEITGTCPKCTRIRGYPNMTLARHVRENTHITVDCWCSNCEREYTVNRIPEKEINKTPNGRTLLEEE